MLDETQKNSEGPKPPVSYFPCIWRIKPAFFIAALVKTRVVTQCTVKLINEYN